MTKEGRLGQVIGADHREVGHHLVQFDDDGARIAVRTFRGDAGGDGKGNPLQGEPSGFCLVLGQGELNFLALFQHERLSGCMVGDAGTEVGFSCDGHDPHGGLVLCTRTDVKVAGYGVGQGLGHVVLPSAMKAISPDRTELEPMWLRS